MSPVREYTHLALEMYTYFSRSTTTIIFFFSTVYKQGNPFQFFSKLYRIRRVQRSNAVVDSFLYLAS